MLAFGNGRLDWLLGGCVVRCQALEGFSGGMEGCQGLEADGFTSGAKRARESAADSAEELQETYRWRESIFVRTLNDHEVAWNELAQRNDDKQEAEKTLEELKKVFMKSLGTSLPSATMTNRTREKTLEELKKVSSARNAYHNHFLPLSEGADADGVEAHLEALVGILRLLGCDACLIDAFKGVYQRKTGTCGEWCRWTVDEVANFLTSSEIRGNSSTAPEKKDEEIAAARQRLLDCEEGVRLAKEKLSRFEADLNLAEKDLRTARLADRDAKEMLAAGPRERKELRRRKSSGGGA